jgi:hypothetical protein
MKYWYLVLILLFGCHKRIDRLIGGEIKKDEITIIISGQSNGVSSTDNTTPHATSVWSETGEVYLTYHRGGEDWVHQVPTKSKPSIRSASWIYMGDELARRTGKAVHIVNVAHGNTSSVDYNRYYAEEMYLAIGAYDPDLLIWVQGESDRFQGLTFQQSYDAMKALIDGSRKIKPGLKWYVALDGYANSANYQDSVDMPVRKAQQKLIDERIVFAGADIDRMRIDFPNYFEPSSDSNPSGAEFGGNIGLKEHGLTWFEIIK